jgi:hypothetical protein
LEVDVMTTNGCSIHPRVWGPWKKRAKRNTCAPHSRKKLERQLAGVERHLENHPGDGMNQARRNIIKAALSEMRS